MEKLINYMYHHIVDGIALKEKDMRIRIDAVLQKRDESFTT